MADRVRPALPEDAPAIGAVHAAAWRETYPGLLAAETIDAYADPARRAAFWAGALAQPGHGAFVVEAEGRLSGFGSCGAARDPQLGAEGEVLAIYLLRRAQGRGLGRALLGAMAGELLSRGLGSAGAWALATNVAAAGFYQATGARAWVVKAAQQAWVWDDLRRLRG